MTSGLTEAEPVLSTIDNTLARRRILELALKDGQAPQASYDFIDSQHTLDDGLLHVILNFLLPATRKVKRQSVVIGGDLKILIHVWVMPIHIADKPSIAKRGWYNNIYEVHIIVPLREDLTGIIW